MKRVIYTQRVEIIEHYGERRDCADQRIADFIYQCGFIPIPVPNIKDIAEKIVEEINPAGIILTGGNSLVHYGGNALERDAVDKLLIDYAIENKTPLYGFCRGMQSILDYFGSNLTEVKGHVATRHRITGKLGGCEVNSYHNQACVQLKENSELEILAQTEDGVIEAIKHRRYPILGTMWHPEREDTYSEKDVRRVKGLFGGKNE